MGWLKKLFTDRRQPPAERQVYATPWDAIQAFIHDPRWNVTILEEGTGWCRVEYDGIIGELIDDPGGEWLQVRFRDPFTEKQAQNELDMYVGWTHHCAQHTLFRWDIDEARQEYVGDAFALLKDQFNAAECIWAAFNSARLLTHESNQLCLGRSFSSLVQGKKRGGGVIISLWDWLESSLAPPGTTIEHSSYHENSYWMGSTIGSAKTEQWAYYAVLRFSAPDFMPYMQRSEDDQLRLYRMHLGIQRWFPRIRNFIILTPDRPETNGMQETSMAILASSGTNLDQIIDRCVREAYEAVREITEWFHFDFNETSAPWFDHTVKKPQTGYTRDFKPRGMPELPETSGVY
jgi:hypothetical protein